MIDPDEKEIIEPVGDYQCAQCGERHTEPEKIHYCFYCESGFCPHCRKRDSDPVTGETVDICSTCAERIQEIADDKRKVIEQAAEIEGLKGEAKTKSITRIAHLVECTRCEASVGLWATVETAIKAWNRRARIAKELAKDK